MLGRRHLFRLVGAASIAILAMTASRLIEPVRDVTAEQQTTSESFSTHRLVEFVEHYCLDCHNSADRVAELDLEQIAGQPIEDHADVWERVVRKLFVRQMPPAETALRPDDREYRSIELSLGNRLDRLAEQNPDPGRTSTFRRLTRTEYQNVIGDLLAVKIDAASLLPADPSSHGFDNITVGLLTPTLMDRYVSAAQGIARTAVGSAGHGPSGYTVRMPADRTQERHVEGLPLGTRGGTLIEYHFPRSGEYSISVRLTRDRNEEVEGLREPHEMVVLLDRQEVSRFRVQPPADPRDHTQVDKHLRGRVHVLAGPHQLGVTFVDKGISLAETLRQPYAAHFNMHRHPRRSPAVYQVSITGPYDDQGPGETPSRRRLFTSLPDRPEAELGAARQILTRLARHAYRRPVDESDIAGPLELFRQARDESGFEAGIELALSAILVSPHFLFRVEHDPPDVPAGTPYFVSDIELASRLSFFLWSSLPDETLLDLAERGELTRPDVLREQVRRMLRDDRSAALASNFASQWLHIRNLESFTPDLRRFPDFDDNLEEAFRRETESLVLHVLRKDESVVNLLRPKQSYLNERLAEHYRIPHIYGSRFRPVTLTADSCRGGLLRQGSVLSVTSYATRTSPVIRGKWILENLLGTPPPPPPANVPALEDNIVSAQLPVRERLAAHRAQQVCASCHNMIDPPGFALENYDAIGRWRVLEAEKPIDASAGLPDGSRFAGVDGLEKALLSHPDWFVTTLTEKLLTYALGRGVAPSDGPAVRKIVRQAAAEDYRLSSLIMAITESVPFRMRMTPMAVSRK